MSRPVAARRIRPFTPSQESSSLLSERTVGQQSQLEIIVSRLIDAARSRNRAHSLIIGPRGAGKTHLLNVAIHRARANVEVNHHLVFVKFDEDAVGIGRYRDLLAETLAALSGSSGRPKLSSTPERDISDLLGDRVLVLAIENLDRVFSTLGKGGQQDFRGWVEDSRQILVLGTSPSLFKGVQDRALPWWGNFGVHQLSELTLAEGQELLIRLVTESGDIGLAQFMQTDKGKSRLQAIHALAGGSPRIWMILSECLTVENLDELVPAVEALLEGLVPYYQQLLWDLSPTEQRLVRELADGPHHAATVQELAQACDIDQRVAATTLKRLADVRWVRADKAPELDQRLTWYRLREPLVRHHFQYRSARDQPLPLIVELLKAWFSTSEKRRYLVDALPGSDAEAVMARAYIPDAAQVLLGYSGKDISHLQADVRSWIFGGSAGSRTKDAGTLIDIVISAATVEDWWYGAISEDRSLEFESPALLQELGDFIRAQSRSLPIVDRIAEALSFLAMSVVDQRTCLVLCLVAASLSRSGDPVGAVELLTRAVEDVDLADTDPMMITVRLERAHWRGLAGDVDTGLEEMYPLVDQCAQVFGPSSREMLSARLRLAWMIRASGDSLTAYQRCSEVVDDCELHLGKDHEDAVVARSHRVQYLIEALDSGGEELVDFPTAALSELCASDKRIEFTLHLHRMIKAVNSGKIDEGFRLVQELVSESLVNFGADDDDTKLANINVAWCLGKSGRHLDAVREFLRLRRAGMVPPAMHAAVLAEIRSNLELAAVHDAGYSGSEMPILRTLGDALSGVVEAKLALPAELADMVASLS